LLVCREGPKRSLKSIEKRANELRLNKDADSTDDVVSSAADSDDDRPVRPLPASPVGSVDGNELEGVMMSDEPMKSSLLDMDESDDDALFSTGGKKRFLKPAGKLQKPTRPRASSADSDDDLMLDDEAVVAPSRKFQIDSDED
jgi:hypothetical protein